MYVKEKATRCITIDKRKMFFGHMEEVVNEVVYETEETGEEVHHINNKG